MPMQLSDYSAALKEVLLPYIRNNFPSQTVMLGQLKRDGGKHFINDEFIFPIRTSRHGGVVNLATDSNNIISSSGATTSRGTVPVERVTGAFELTRLAMDASKGAGAVEEALTFQAKSLVDDFSRHVNRQAYADGVGVVSEVSGSNGANNVEVTYITASLDDGRSIDWYGSVNGDISPTKYFAVNQILGIGTGGADLGTVTAVNGGTSVTTTGSPAFAVNDAVYLMDGSGAGAGTSELLGMRAALSSTTGTSTYEGVARNTIGWTPSFGSASEALTVSRMTTNYLRAQEYAQSGDKYAIFMNLSLFNRYGELLQSLRRTVNSTQLMGGWTGLEFAAGNGVVGVFLDYEVPDGEVIICNLDTWMICQVSDTAWADGDSNTLLRLQNTLNYQAIMYWHLNLACLAPAANGRETQKQG